jgi:hypothetical protein
MRRAACGRTRQRQCRWCQWRCQCQRRCQR